MKVSIIVPTLRENNKYLEKIVSSIKKYSTKEHQIIVATNNGPAWDVNIDGVQIVHNESQGQCQAVNKAVKEAVNEYILILDDDMVAPSNWEKILEKVDGLNFLCGNVMEHGRQGSSFLVNDCGADVDEFDEEKFEKSSIEMSEDITRQGFGFPLLIKKDIWEKIGGYNEELDPWGSNADSFLQYKLMLAGVLMKQYLGILFYHFQCKSGTFTKEEAQPYWTKNNNYFPQFWGFGRSNAPNIWSCEFIIPLDKLIYKPDWAKLKNNEYVQLDETYNESIECSNCRFNYLKFRNNKCPKCKK